MFDYRFYDAPYKGDDGMFVPSDSSAKLVDLAVEYLAGYTDSRVADLCCGGGGFGLAIARTLAGLSVTGVDSNPTAIRCAEASKQLTPLLSPVWFFVGDCTDVLPLAAGFRLVVANPPWVPDGFVPPRTQWDRDEDLFGGPDGLGVSRRVVDNAARMLVPGGVLLLEHGDADQGDTRTLDMVLKHGGFVHARNLEGYTGVPEFVYAVRA